MSDPLTSLVKKIDQKVREAAPKYTERRNLGTFLLFNDSPGRAERLRSWAQTESIQGVSFCIGPVPPRYEVNGEAELTVVIYNPARRGQQQVQANFTFRSGELDSAKSDAIIDALVKVLPK